MANDQDKKPLEDVSPDQIFDDILLLTNMLKDGKHPAELAALLSFEEPTDAAE